jgi:phage terminase large subunit GpA-like protein
MRLEQAQEFRANGLATFYTDRSAHFPYRAKRTVSRWANEERWIARGASPLSQARDIRYNVNVMPWCQEPMDSAGDPDVQVTVLQWASGMAKTEVVVNIIGHSIHEAPKNIFVFYPKDDSRDKFSRDVLQRSLIDPTPCIRALVSEQRTRESNNTIAYKRFAGGSIFMVGSGSAANFRGPRAGVVYGDEIDGMPDSVGGAADGEGDPIFLAFRRAEGFANAVKVLSGTPTYKRTVNPDGTTKFNSRIDFWMAQSDYRKFFAPCRKCASWHVWKFEDIVAPKGHPEKAEILCPACSVAHSDRQRIESVMAAKWRATQAFAGIRGYWIDGVSTTLPAEKGFRSKLHQMVVDAERAAKDPESKKVWTNTFKAECVERVSEEREAPPHQPLLDGREDYATAAAQMVPARALVLTSMSDLHGNRIEIEWRAWSRDEESWGMGHFVIFGDTSRPEVWKEWTRHLQKTFLHELGGKMGLSLAHVDGGWAADRIAPVLIRLKRENVPGVSGKVIMSKGVGRQQAVVMDRWGTIMKFWKGTIIGTWAAKTLIYERLRWHSAEEKPTAGFIHFGKCYSDEFIRQVVSEKSIMRMIDGKEVETFKNPEGNRNEALDLIVGNLAAFRRGNWDFDTIERDLKPPDPDPVPISHPASRPSSNFATKGIRWR